MKTIEKLHQEWMSFQPLPADIQKQIDQKFMLEFNYNSNHLEGNTLTYGQTELLLLFGKVDSDAKMHDLEEMKAHNVCLKMIQEEALSDRPLTETFIRELHQVLLREDYNVHKTLPDGNVTTYTIHAGCYKTRPNSVRTVTGELFEYASPEETPALMTDLVSWYNDIIKDSSLSVIELVSLFHYRYIRIHPFEDGNGRIARLLVNFILLRAQYPMIIVRSDDKEKYLSALNKSDVNVGMVPSVGAHAKLSDITPFVEYMKSCLERALTLRIRAAKGESIEEDDDWKKKLAVLSKLRESKPARTAELSTLAVIEGFIPTINHMIESLSSCGRVFYKIAGTYQYRTQRGWVSSDRAAFPQYAQTHKIINPVLFQLDIKISETQSKYDCSFVIECSFREFCYDIILSHGKEAYPITLNYGKVPSKSQMKKLEKQMGQYIVETYTKYCEEFDK